MNSQTLIFQILNFFLKPPKFSNQFQFHWVIFVKNWSISIQLFSVCIHNLFPVKNLTNKGYPVFSMIVEILYAIYHGLSKKINWIFQGMGPTCVNSTGRSSAVRLLTLSLITTLKKRLDTLADIVNPLSSNVQPGNKTPLKCQCIHKWLKLRISVGGLSRRLWDWLTHIKICTCLQMPKTALKVSI